MACELLDMMDAGKWIAADVCRVLGIRQATRAVEPLTRGTRRRIDATPELVL